MKRADTIWYVTLGSQEPLAAAPASSQLLGLAAAVFRLGVAKADACSSQGSAVGKLLADTA
jgi:hypothetical protein